MDYVEPELRENTGRDRGQAANNTLFPKIIGYDDLQGDLQVQTELDRRIRFDRSYGKSPAALRGLKYIVITDHTKRLAMAHGLDEREDRPSKWRKSTRRISG